MTQTKPCFICQARLPFIGPTLCDEHGGDEQRDNDKRFTIVKEPKSQPDIDLYFETTGDPDLGVPDTLLSSYRTNFTQAWCSRHWKAYEGTSPWCPVCRMAHVRKTGEYKYAKTPGGSVETARTESVKRPEQAEPAVAVQCSDALVAEPPGDSTRDAMTATDAELSARGWRQGDGALTKAYHQAMERIEPRPKGKGRKMARKKADEKNGEAAGTNGHSDPTKVINMSKMLRIKLTDAEMRDRGMAAAAKRAEWRALDAEFDAYKKEQKGKMDALEADIDVLLTQIDNGHESRPVACRKEYVYRTNTVRVVRVDTGEVIEERAMMPEEIEEHRQVPIQAAGANEETAKGDPDEKPKRGRKKKAAAEQQPSPAE